VLERLAARADALLAGADDPRLAGPARPAAAADNVIRVPMK
jgi:hypothetical protein